MEFIVNQIKFNNKLWFVFNQIRLGNVTLYNRHRMPKSSGNEVFEEVWIQEITRISEITSDFEIDIYMNEIWVDHRLSYSHMNPCKPNVSVDHTIYDQIWTPNTCFVNSKMADIHESPFPNIYIMIYPDGTIWINYRVKLTGLHIFLYFYGFYNHLYGIYTQ